MSRDQLYFVLQIVVKGISLEFERLCQSWLDYFVNNLSTGKMVSLSLIIVFTSMCSYEKLVVSKCSKITGGTLVGKELHFK